MEKGEPKPPESSAEEGKVINHYLDLRAGIFNVHASKEDTMDIAQKFIDVVRILNAGGGLDSSFREEMLGRIKDLETQYLAFKKAVQLIKQLEQESRGNILVPHIYRQAVTASKEAMKAGVPESTLLTFKSMLEAYGERVRQLNVRLNG